MRLVENKLGMICVKAVA